MSCPACDTQFLLAAIIKEEKVTEVITDLTEAELDKFKNVGSLTSDEILDMRNFMDTLRGSGVETGGPNSFGQKERYKFSNELDKFIAYSSS